MLAGLDRQEIAFACKVALTSDAVREREWIVEQEVFIAKDIEKKRQIVGRNEAQRFVARDIEQAVRRIERRREQGARSPFETMGLAVAGVDDRAAVARQHIEHVVVE